MCGEAGCGNCSGAQRQSVAPMGNWFNWSGHWTVTTGVIVPCICKTGPLGILPLRIRCRVSCLTSQNVATRSDVEERSMPLLAGFLESARGAMPAQMGIRAGDDMRIMSRPAYLIPSLGLLRPVRA